MLTIRITYAESMAKYFDKVLILDLSIITRGVFSILMFQEYISKSVFILFIYVLPMAASGTVVCF